MRRGVCGVFAAVVATLVAPAASAQVLRVGSYNGIPGQYSSIQAAVNAAQPGDTILVGPGDYKTTNSSAPSDASDTPAAVLITTPNITLRGMDRNGVIVDGTTPGSPQCSSGATDQNLGPGGSGLNGIMVWKANNVAVQNLTVCNFLAGSGNAGNEIWWNGGDGGGQIGGWGFDGDYLTATSTYFGDESTAAGYGIFSSDWSGGTWDQTYVSNFNDSGYYIGACQQVCDQTLNHGWSEYNALGYSGTNSGGQLVIENSQFDNNEDGFDTNSQNNDDWPSPQDGACPNGGISPITHTHSCWVFMDNYVHDNNNPNVPSAGAAAAGPTGTGMSVSGGRDDTIMNNTFSGNGAWGVIFVPYPDTETPPSDANPPCNGGVSAPGNVCNYDDWGNALIGNTFTNNGFFGNDTNGDFAESTSTPGEPINCYDGNVDTAGAVTSSPANLQQTNATCGQPAVAPDPNASFVSQVSCDSEFFGPGSACPPGASYPRRTSVIMHPLPSGLPSMPDPCSGVSANPWCSGQVQTMPTAGRCSARFITVRLTLAKREKFRSLSVKVARGKWHRHAAHGRRARLRLDLGAGRSRNVWVRFLERITVRGHREFVRFARIYRRC
jgi:hypothetical protein